MLFSQRNASPESLGCAPVQGRKVTTFSMSSAWIWNWTPGVPHKHAKNVPLACAKVDMASTQTAALILPPALTMRRTSAATPTAANDWCGRLPQRHVCQARLIRRKACQHLTD